MHYYIAGNYFSTKILTEGVEVKTALFHEQVA